MEARVRRDCSPDRVAQLAAQKSTGRSGCADRVEGEGTTCKMIPVGLCLLFSSPPGGGRGIPTLLLWPEGPVSYVYCCVHVPI